MSAQHYEGMFLLDSAKTSGNLDTAKSNLHGTLEKFGAEIIASRPWDDRRLAYPIKGHKKGQYYLIFFKCESLKMTEMENDFRLSELIVRHMVIHIEPKWLNELMEVAKDDHRLALQAMRDEAPEGGGDGMDEIPGMDGDRPRRRPRHMDGDK